MPAVAASTKRVSVVSVNLAKVTDIDRMVSELRSHPALREADVFLLQEVVRKKGTEPSSADLLARRLNLHVAFVSPSGEQTEGGLAIMSRYPLRDVRTRQLQNVNLVFRSRKRVALAATVDSPCGVLRVINAHLDTRINPAERVRQLEPVLEEARSFPGPAIIGGDLNTNDMQWVSHVVPVPYPGWQAAAVRKLMKERGFATPFETRRPTFDHMKMQLDWIFSTGLDPVGSAIQPLDFSDHHAIWAQFSSPRL